MRRCSMSPLTSPSRSANGRLLPVLVSTTPIQASTISSPNSVRAAPNAARSTDRSTFLAKKETSMRPYSPAAAAAVSPVRSIPERACAVANASSMPTGGRALRNSQPGSFGARRTISATSGRRCLVPSAVSTNEWPPDRPGPNSKKIVDDPESGFSCAATHSPRSHSMRRLKTSSMRLAFFSNPRHHASILASCATRSTASDSSRMR